MLEYIVAVTVGPALVTVHDDVVEFGTEHLPLPESNAQLYAAAAGMLADNSSEANKTSFLV
ncbi:hypothetical protein GCM10025771_16730 [Niveibacterium umoris]